MMYFDCDLHRALMNTGYIIASNFNPFRSEWKPLKTWYVPKPDVPNPNAGVPKYEQGDWQLRYVRGRGGNTYPAEFLEMYPYTFGRL